MGKLTTHVLDTANGCPAGGMKVRFYRLENGAATELAAFALNADGRADAPLLDGAGHRPGRYRLVFSVAAYFAGRGRAVGGVEHVGGELAHAGSFGWRRGPVAPKSP